LFRDKGAFPLKWLVFKLAFFCAKGYGYFCYYRKRRRRKEIEDKFTFFLGERFNLLNRQKVVRHIFELRGTRKVMHYLIPLLDKRMIERFFKLEGVHHLNLVLKGGRGVVLMAGHLGNPHLAFCGLRSMGYPLILIKGGSPRQVKPSKLRYRETLEDTIFIHDRELAADYKERILETLRSGKIIHYYGDTSVGRKREKVPFLGREMDFATGMVRLAHKAKAAIIPCIHLYHQGKITIILKGSIEHDWEKGEGEYKRIISEFARLLETHILEAPEQYMGVYGPTVMSEYFHSQANERKPSQGER
jgi:lauroyl/myristoyl acyltransferase